MYRARIELLEKRKMFSVTDLILDPFNSGVAAAAEPGQSATIVDFIDEESTAPVLQCQREEVRRAGSQAAAVVRHLRSLAAHPWWATSCPPYRGLTAPAYGNSVSRRVGNKLPTPPVLALRLAFKLGANAGRPPIA